MPLKLTYNKICPCTIDERRRKKAAKLAISRAKGYSAVVRVRWCLRHYLERPANQRHCKLIRGWEHTSGRAFPVNPTAVLPCSVPRTESFNPPQRTASHHIPHSFRHGGNDASKHSGSFRSADGQTGGRRLARFLSFCPAPRGGGAYNW